MEDFKSWLAIEKQELDEKRDKLAAFIGGEKYLLLDGNTRYLMGRQLRAMTIYSGGLDDRIEALNTNVVAKSIVKTAAVLEG